MNTTPELATKRFATPIALLFAVLCMLVLASPVLSAQKASGAPPKDAKCPVCGMIVAKYPDWNASIVYRDGTTAYFDGPKDLFSYYLNPHKYDPGKKRADVAAIGVKDYYSLATIDARQAYFVVGSNVLGPMGKELIPFARKADADGFRVDHQGRRIVRFPEVTLEILKTLE
jgi:nitrous oxide reductase accessory protein NosL